MYLDQYTYQWIFLGSINLFNGYIKCCFACWKYVHRLYHRVYNTVTTLRSLSKLYIKQQVLVSISSSTLYIRLLLRLVDLCKGYKKMLLRQVCPWKGYIMQYLVQQAFLMVARRSWFQKLILLLLPKSVKRI